MQIRCEVVKKYRLARGLTQKGLAKASGLSRSTIANIERGKPPEDMKVSTLGYLAGALGCKQGVLLGESAH